MVEAVRPAALAGAALAPSAAGAGAPALVTRALSVRARRRAILEGLELAVEPGSLCVVVGPSGVGKSTLLKCFNRLLDLVPGLEVEGEVRIGATSVYGPRASASPQAADRLRRRVGMLFQQPVVFPKSIGENVLFGLKRVGTAAEQRVPKAEWAARVETALRRASLWDEVASRLDEPAAELSVGQQQRLCLARALALEPSVLLMDEPTSALDPEATAQIERLARSLAGRTTLLWVTHDPAQAERLADTLVRMETRDGAGCIASCTVLDRAAPARPSASEKETEP